MGVSGKAQGHTFISTLILVHVSGDHLEIQLFVPLQNHSSVSDHRSEKDNILTTFSHIGRFMFQTEIYEWMKAKLLNKYCPMDTDITERQADKNITTLTTIKLDRWLAACGPHPGGGSHLACKMALMKVLSSAILQTVSVAKFPGIRLNYG